MVHASLFSGIGGFDLAAEWMGWENAFHCEINHWCAKVLQYHFPNSKHYADITATDFREWSGKIDILTGGFPCQPFSCAGKRKGQDDDRYLWPEMLRAIREIRPTWVVGENVGGIVSMVQPGSEVEVEHQAAFFETTDKETVLEQEFVVETVCRDLEREGYTVQPIIIPACAVGAPHRRDRIWFVAYSNNERGGSRCQSVSRKDDEIQEWDKNAKPCNADISITPYPECERRRQIFKEVQPSQSNGNCAHGFSNEWDVTDSNSTEFQKRVRHKRWAYQKKDRTGMDYGIKRPCCLWPAPYSVGKRLSSISIPVSVDKKRWKEKKRCLMQYSSVDRRTLYTTPWQNFPTQSPVCSGDDGFPSRLDGITFPKWRAESVKAYGNAIVPQVAYEIFEAINEVENLQIP